jgi:RND family efflux transporter MFP subunit
MKVWKIIAVPLMILVLMLPVAACGTASNQPYTQTQEVQVVRGDLITVVSGSGKIAVATDAKLSFLSGGKLAVLNVQEGDRVTKGEVLASLDTTSLELAVKAAQVDLDTATNNYARLTYPYSPSTFTFDVPTALADVADAQRELDKALDSLEIGLGFDQYWQAWERLKQAQAKLTEAEQMLGQGKGGAMFPAASGVDFWTIRAAQLAMEKAQLALDNANTNLENATITAPFDGVVANLYAKQGDIIPTPLASPQIIMYLVDTTSMEVDINIDEMDVPSVEAGQRAIINIDALPGTTLNGAVTSVGTAPDARAAAAGATIYVTKVNFAIPQGLAIKVGMNARVDIVTNEHKNVLLLPNDAIKKDEQGKSYVEIMSNRQVITKPVVIGLSNSTQTEIVSGLNEGDSVISGISAGRWSLQ